MTLDETKYLFKLCMIYRKVQSGDMDDEVTAFEAITDYVDKLMRIKNDLLNRHK